MMIRTIYRKSVSQIFFWVTDELRAWSTPVDTRDSPPPPPNSIRWTPLQWFCFQNHSIFWVLCSSQKNHSKSEYLLGWPDRNTGLNKNKGSCIRYFNVPEFVTPQLAHSHHAIVMRFQTNSCQVKDDNERPIVAHSYSLAASRLFSVIVFSKFIQQYFRYFDLVRISCFLVTYI